MTTYLGKDIILSPEGRQFQYATSWYTDAKNLELTVHTWIILLSCMRPKTLIRGSLSNFYHNHNIPYDDENVLEKFRQTLVPKEEVPLPEHVTASVEELREWCNHNSLR